MDYSRSACTMYFISGVCQSDGRKMKKKILFLIHDLDHGGAEKVLVNLVNNMDRSKFDITVMALFGGGVNEQFLAKDIRLINCYARAFPGNSHVMKLLTPEQLHKLYIKEHYDIEVAYLEGPAVRIVSGCEDKSTKLVYWIHCTMRSPKEFAVGFRSLKEAIRCHSRFHGKVFVSQGVMDAFKVYCPVENGKVLYNTNESDKILALADETLPDGVFRDDEVKLIGVGKLEAVKGFDRLARIHKRLIDDGFPIHTYILGEGRKKEELESWRTENGLTESLTLLGYQTNPYKYVAKCDLFICASHAEGFSTAATEALIVGTPVCTVEVSGMKEMLGEHNEWGIVTENDEEALYQGIKRLLDDPELLAHYKERAAQRGRIFSTENTVNAVQDMLLNL